MYRKVLVGTDGSATAAKAVDRAVEVAKASGASLTILSAGRPDRAAQVVDAEAERARRLRRRHRHASRRRRPRRRPRPAAPADGYDLLVVGNRGMTGVTRFLRLGLRAEQGHPPAPLLAAHRQDHVSRRALLARRRACSRWRGARSAPRSASRCTTTAPGVVTVAVGLDADAVERCRRLEEQLRLDDLVATGWEITGPTEEADGFTWIRASKPFATPEEAGRVLAEVSGEDGPFQRLRGAPGSAPSPARPTGSRAPSTSPAASRRSATRRSPPPSTASRSARTSPPSRSASAPPSTRPSRSASAVRLPGDVTSTNAPTEADNGAVWQPRLSEAGPSSCEPRARWPAPGRSPWSSWPSLRRRRRPRRRRSASRGAAAVAGAGAPD